MLTPHDYSWPQLLEVERVSHWLLAGETLAPVFSEDESSELPSPPPSGTKENPILILTNEELEGDIGTEENPIYISMSDEEACDDDDDDDDETLPPSSPQPISEVPNSEHWGVPSEEHPDAWTVRSERYLISTDEMWVRWFGVYGGGQPFDIEERFFRFCLEYLKPEYCDMWIAQRWEW